MFDQESKRLQQAELELGLTVAKYTRSPFLTLSDISSILAHAMNRVRGELDEEVTAYDVRNVIKWRWENKYYIAYLLDQGMTQHKIIKQFGYSPSQVSPIAKGIEEIGLHNRSEFTRKLYHPWQKVKTVMMDLNNVNKEDIKRIKERIISEF